MRSPARKSPAGHSGDTMMFLGFLMIGMATGFMAAFAALVVGQGIGIALLAYVLTGLIVTLLGSLISQLPATPYGQPHLPTSA